MRNGIVGPWSQTAETHVDLEGLLRVLPPYQWMTVSVTTLRLTATIQPFRGTLESSSATMSINIQVEVIDLKALTAIALSVSTSIDSSS
jgi:hypothetical protein